MDALEDTMIVEAECIATPDNAVTDADIIDAATSEEDKITYKDSTYEIVSKVAYLIGVPKRIFENEHEAPKLDVYPSCSSVKKMKASNKMFYTGTRDDLVSQGYSPCGNCHP